MNLPLHWKLMLCSVFFLGICACDRQPDDAYVNKDLGVRFDFPDGWSRMETDEYGPGKKALVVIGNSSRTAMMSLSAFDIRPFLDAIETKVILSYASQEKINRGAAFFVHINSTFEKSFSKRYDDYELLDQTWTKLLPGGAATEMIFTGSRPGEDPKWRKVVIILVEEVEDYGMIMAFSVPMDANEKFQKDFRAIENSWKKL